MFKTILGFDIEDFSKDNDTILLGKKRIDLEYIIKTAAENSDFKNVLEEKLRALDTGDGFFFTLDTRDYAKIFHFFHQIEIVSKKMNAIRFRGIIHTGECSPTKSFFTDSSINNNYVGSGIIEASRYLDCSPLKELLKVESSRNFVFGLSTKIFFECKGQTFFEEGTFIEYPFVVKKFNNSIFLYTAKQKLLNNESVDNNTFSLTEEFKQFLNTNMLNDLHNNSKGIDASSLYVFPEIIRDYLTKPGQEAIDSFQYFKEYCEKPINLIISGEEQIGKTTLCKKIFNLFYDTKKLLPLYLCFNEKYSGLIENNIKKAMHDQYDKKINELTTLKKILIIDNYHLIEPKYQRKVIDELVDMPNYIIILIVDSNYNVNFAEREIEYTYESLTIKEFGPKLRNKLIEKWMEVEMIADKNYKTIDELMDYVSNILLKGLVPSTPMNILVILEEKKYFNPLNSEITSKGHCYQALIYIALRKVEIKDTEIDIYLSFLENFSNCLYGKNTSGLSEENFNIFYQDYLMEYNQPIEKRVFLKNLIETKIIKLNSIGEYCFSSDYIYYYFISKYLADHYREKSVFKEIEKIYNNLERTQYGYMGVFIIHHLRDEKILNEIELNLLMQYDKYDNATMDKKEIEFLQRHIDTLGRLAINTRNLSYEKRQERLKIEEKNEIEEIESRKKEVEEEDNNETSIVDEIKQLRKALRTVEVMGHILKAKPGSFKKEMQKKYFSDALNVYFRITKRFLEDFKNNENDFIEYFMDRIFYFNTEKLSTEDIYNLSRRYFCQYNLMNYYSCIYKASSILCSEQIVQIVSEVCNEIDTTLSYFIKLQCEMWYKKRIPIDDIKKAMKNLEGIQIYVLSDLIINYCELHDVKFDEKQKIASILKIEMRRLNKEITG